MHHTREAPLSLFEACLMKIAQNLTDYESFEAISVHIGDQLFAEIIKYNQITIPLLRFLQTTNLPLSALTLTNCKKIFPSKVKKFKRKFNFYFVGLQKIVLKHGSFAKEHLELFYPLIDSLKEIHISKSSVTNSCIIAIQSFKNLERLSIEDSDALTNIGVEALKDLKNLEYLSIFRCANVTQFTDDNFLHLSNLQHLNIGGTSMSIDSLLKISTRLIRLKSIQLAFLPFFIKFALSLSRLYNLEMVSISKSPFCLNNDLIAGLSKLRIIDASWTQTTDADLTALLNLKNLFHLDISHTNVTNACIAETLCKLISLQELILCAPGISGLGNDVLAPLSSLYRLECLDLRDSGIVWESEAVMRDFQATNWNFLSQLSFNGSFSGESSTDDSGEEEEAAADDNNANVEER